jgi:hypothetical protein
VSLVRALVVLGLVIVGCNGGDGAETMAPGTDPCTLMEPVELREILGMEVGDGEPGIPADALMDGAPAADCRWSTPDNARTLTLVLRRALTADDADAAISSVRESFASGGFTPLSVEGVGDDGFFAFNQLHVRSGADYLTVSLTGLSNDEALAAARTAATQSLQRLAAPTAGT